MPTVPMYGAPKVETRGVDAPKYRGNVQSPYVDLGKGLQQAGNQFGQIAQAQLNAEREKFNDAVTNDVFTKLGDWEHTNVQDPNNPVAAKTLKGEQYTPNVTDETIKNFEEYYTKEVRVGLASDEQRIRADKMFAQRRQSMQEELTRHEAQQHEIVAKGKYDGATDTAIADGAVRWDNDPKRKESRQKLEELVLQRAVRYGMSEEEYKAELLNKLTRFHTGVLMAMKQNDPIRAAKYLTDYTSEIDPTKLKELRDEIDGEATKTRARAAADDIQNSVGPKNYAEQYAELKRRREAGTLDLRTATAAEAALKNDQSVAEHNEREKQSQLLGTVTANIRGRYQNKMAVLLDEENDPEFLKLNPQGKSAARALVIEFDDKRRVAGNTSNAARKEANSQALREFRERPRSEKMRYADDFKALDEYADRADEPTRRIMHAMARDAKVEVERGEEVKGDEYMRRIRATVTEVPALRDDKDLAELFIGRMILNRSNWKAANPNNDPRSKDIDDMVRWELRYGDYGIFGSNKFGFQVEPDDKTQFLMHEAEDQPYYDNRTGLPTKPDFNASKPSTATSSSRPFAIPPGYTLVVDPKGNPAQVKNENLQTFLSKNPTWKKVE